MILGLSSDSAVALIIGRNHLGKLNVPMVLHVFMLHTQRANGEWIIEKKRSEHSRGFNNVILPVFLESYEIYCSLEREGH